jgi:ribosomal-protein-alanine N-acetyltransferase
MFVIETPRLILAPTPLDVLKARLERDEVVADVPLMVERAGRRVAETLCVRFPPEWPGDALALFPLWIARRETLSGPDAWGGTIIDRAELLAVGQMSFKDPPDKTGAVELGYGVNRSYHNCGYASEMARALVDWALAQRSVTRVTAECLEDNAASIRVLEKSGFRRAGRRLDEEGSLILWERTR